MSSVEHRQHMKREKETKKHYVTLLFKNKVEQNSNFKIFESALYMKSGRMPLNTIINI